MQAAGPLIEESGLAGFSMIRLAERAGVNRATAYNFFPTKYALFHALARQYVDQFLPLITAHMEQGSSRNWQERLSALIDHAAQLYNREATARTLFLAGGISTEVDAVHHEINNHRLARFLRSTLETDDGLPALPESPDPYLVATEAVIAVFGTSQRTHGEIRPDFVTEASCLAITYLENCRRRAFTADGSGAQSSPITRRVSSSE